MIRLNLTMSYFIVLTSLVGVPSLGRGQNNSPPLEELIFSSKPGTLTEVIQTPLGFEIVKIHEKRVPKLEDIRKEIEPLVRAQKLDNWVNEAEKGLDIKIDEDYFKASPASSVQGTQK